MLQNPLMHISRMLYKTHLILPSQEEVAAQLKDKQVVGSVHNIKQNEERLQDLKAFWVPTQTPGAAVGVSTQTPD